MDAGESLTAQELAREAGISDSRVRQLLIAGRFPHALKRGGAWFIPDADVRAYLAHRDLRRKDVPRQGTLPGVEE